MLIPLGIPFLIGPLHYLYAKHLIHHSSQFKKNNWLHLLPFFLFQLSLLPDFFKPGEEILISFQATESLGLPLKGFVFNWTVIIQGLTYMLLTVRIIKQYSRFIRDVFSTIEKIKLDWLRNITYIMLIVVVIFLIENLFPLVGINLSDFFNFSSILFAVSVYTMGYLGLSKSEYLQNLKLKAIAALLRNSKILKKQVRNIKNPV